MMPLLVSRIVVVNVADEDISGNCAGNADVRALSVIKRDVLRIAANVKTRPPSVSHGATPVENSAAAADGEAASTATATAADEADATVLG